MSEPNAPEPTMEEILASIRRIISEDEPPSHAAPLEDELEHDITAAAPPPSVAEHEDVLELTDPVHEPAAAAPLETIGDLDIMPVGGHTPPPPPISAPSAPIAFESPFDDEPLVGASAADSAASAFGSLAHHVLMPAEGRTLEEVVREMLRPLLKAWLDQHLPGIVQAKVDEEVARIARRRV